MAFDAGELQHWRRFFSGAGGADIFEVIDAAVAVAALDRPSELKQRRGLIAQRLFAAGAPGTSHSCRDVDEGKEEESMAAPVPEEAAPVKKARQPVTMSKKDDRPSPKSSMRSTEKTPAPVKNHPVREKADQLVPAAVKASSVRVRSATLPPAAAALREKAPAPSSEQTMETKLATVKRKLREGYQRFADAKRQRRIQVIEAPEIVRRRRQSQHPIIRLRDEIRCAATGPERRALMSFSRVIM